MLRFLRGTKTRALLSTLRPKEHRVDTSYWLHLKYSSTLVGPNQNSSREGPRGVEIIHEVVSETPRSRPHENIKEAAEEKAPLPIFHKHLADVAAMSQVESAVHKLARYTSRLHDATTRRDELRALLRKLAIEMGVYKDRAHPIVQCRSMLKATGFLSLRGTIDAIKTRTPKDQIGLTKEQLDSIRFEARISEMQMRIVRRLLGSFWARRKRTGELSQPAKNMLRSARGQVTIMHRLVADSMEEFDVMRGDEWAIRRKAEAERGSKGQLSGVVGDEVLEY
ncbi:hypothetical protein FRC09_010996 [Ceratobasidium sp. 395]|nr:hypothetical protein FRC09_010996 [Ceratobasidium sp. 395]